MSKPIRCARGRLVVDGRVNEEYIRRSLALAGAKVPSGHIPRVLVIMDADDDCPAEVAASIMGAARQGAGHLVVGVVSPNREFEACFLAAIDSLRGVRGIDANAEWPRNSEAVRGANERLRQLRGPPAYSETVDQPAFTALVDLERARTRSRSFQKLLREMERLAIPPEDGHTSP